MDDDYNFAGKIIKELKNRGRTAIRDKDDLATRTIRWFDYFTEFFIEEASSLDDDLLFFVRDRPMTDESPIFVKRRTSDQTLPKLDSLIRWEETFYINLVAHLNCQVRISVLKDGLVINSSQERAFATPTGDMGHKLEESFPRMRFSLQSDEKFILKDNQTLCVEMRVIFVDHLDNNNNTSNEQQKKKKHDNTIKNNDTTVVSGEMIESYKAWKNDSEGLACCLFQGSVGYLPLKATHKKKIGMRLTANSSSILMRGPEGRGYARLSVNGIMEGGGGGDYQSIIRRLTSSRLDLECSLDFISMDWRLVILNLYGVAN